MNDYSPLFDIESYNITPVETGENEHRSYPVAGSDDASVISWDFPVVEKEDQQTMEDFKTKMARIEREAYEKGFAQGQKDGLDLEKSKLQEMGKQYESLLAELRDLKTLIYSESENEMLRMIMLIVTKIIGEEIKTGEQIIRHSIQSASRFLSDKRKIRVIINPDDMEEVKKMLPDLSALTKGGHFQLTEDLTVGKGGCVLETGFGRINATIEDQLSEIEDIIRKEYLLNSHMTP